MDSNKLLSQLFEENDFNNLKYIIVDDKIKRLQIIKKEKIFDGNPLLNPKYFENQNYIKIGFDKIDDIPNLENIDKLKNNIIDIKFVDKVNYIWIGCDCFMKFDFVKFPDSLKTIYIMDNFDKPLFNTIFNKSTLFVLDYIYYENKNIIESLPNIQYLYIKCLSSSIKKCKINLPMTLKLLCIQQPSKNKEEYNEFINAFNIPFDCQVIIVPDKDFYQYQIDDFNEYEYLVKKNLI